MLASIQRFFRGFYYAIQGIKVGFGGRNFRFEVVVMLMVLAIGWWLNLSRPEWWVVLILIGLVLGAELMNTAVEDLANTLRDEACLPYQSTKKARDLAAGAVLVVAVLAAIIGLSIFLPRLLLQLM